MNRIAERLLNYKRHDEYYKQALSIGFPIVKCLFEITHDFRDLNHINAYSIMRLVIAIPADYQQVIDLLSSAKTTNAQAMLLVYRFSRKEPIDPAGLFALAVKARGHSSHDSGGSLTILEIGTLIAESTDLVALLTPVLLMRPGDPYAQEVACAWIFEYPGSAFIPVLERCLYDDRFQPILGAELTLEKIDPVAAEECMRHLIQTGRTTSRTALWTSSMTYDLPE